MNEWNDRTNQGDRKKVTVRLSKPIRYRYQGDRRRLLPASEKEQEFAVSVEMVLPSIDLSTTPFVQNLMREFRPDHIADRMLILMQKSDDRDFNRALDQAEYDVVRLSAARVLGSDDDPTRVYKFLGEVLKEASREMEHDSRGFVQKLTAALQDRGLIL